MSGNLWTNIKANHWNKNSDGISTSADMLILFEVGLLAPLGHFFQPREKNATVRTPSCKTSMFARKKLLLL
jgi:hypothetical protein